ncbi:hypothetical protein C8R45DRAFT_1086407 [Mycena sanguinolenta]|nr:hypothetical protein C8R45DRAFT_1086407 [Mycena sanguinolenta]
MGRWTQYDEDAYRLPEGMVRTGYDADTGCYTFSSRGGGTYTGIPGSYYGPMYPMGTDVTPKTVVVVAGDPDGSGTSSPEKGRRIRRDQSSGSDDEEPVMVERTPSLIMLTNDSATLTVTDAESSRVASKTRSSTSGRDVSSPTEESKSAASRAKIQSLISSDHAVSKTPTESSKSSAPRTKIQSATHSRSASTSAAPRTVLTKAHTRRSASEHVHSPRPQRPHLPIAARFMTLPDPPATPGSPDKAVAPSSRAPSGPGASASAQKLPSKRRHASEQSPSSSEQPTPSATASTRSSTSPRTSARLTPSVSATVPRTSRTMAMAMSPDLE